jgi:diguanylate cyclase (GGDEF)-like protein
MVKTRWVADRRRVPRLWRAVPIGTGLTIAIVAAIFIVVLSHSEPSIDGLTAGRNQADQILKGMVDEETGLRGYLDTGSRTFLQPYIAGRQEIAGGNAGSLALTSRSDLAEPMIDLRVAEHTWLTQWATPTAIAVDQPRTEAQLRAVLLRGKTLFDAYRVTQAAVDGRVSADILAEEAAEQNVIVFGGLVAAMVVLATTAVAWRHRRLLARLARLSPPVATNLTDQSAGGGLAVLGVIATPTLPEDTMDVGQLTDTLITERARFTALETESGLEASRLQLIVAVGQEIAGSLSLAYVSEAVAAAAISITGYRTAKIWLMSDDQEALTMVQRGGVEHGGRKAGDCVALGEGVVGRCGLHGRVFSRRLNGSIAAGHRSDLPTPGLAVPMIAAARVVGVLELSSDDVRSIDEETLEVIRKLANQAATAVDAARLHQRDEEISHTDVLTELANRRRLGSDLDSEVARSARYERPLAFIMLDVDHFKDFNDTNGHQLGDEILAELAKTFSGVLRQSDTPYRYGGEEFCVLLRETNIDAASAVAERLRVSIEDRFAGASAAKRVTASLGVAAMPDNATDGASLVAAADRALYTAKEAGRNCVRLAPPLRIGPVRATA